MYSIDSGKYLKPKCYLTVTNIKGEKNNKKCKQSKRRLTLSLLLADGLVWSKYSKKPWSKNWLGLHKSFMDVTGVWEFHIACTCVLKDWSSTKTK